MLTIKCHMEMAACHGTCGILPLPPHASRCNHRQQPSAAATSKLSCKVQLLNIQQQQQQQHQPLWWQQRYR
jgi:hypothetical protein